MSVPTAYRACETAITRLPTKLPTPREMRLRRMFEDLAKKPLGTVPTPALQGTEGHIVPKDLRYIGSYNWTDASTPTIVVPGSPPIWAEKPTPLTVPRDSGKDFIDQNGYRMRRKFTLLPLIKAVQTVKARKKAPSKFDWPSVDFVTDRGGLRRLVAWANSKSSQWRIDTQLAGDKTVLISVWSPATKETSGLSNSYGFSFERACTHPAPGCENGTGHHRIVTYDFGGLRLVVRFEVDACLPLSSTPSHPKSSQPRNSTQRTKRTKHTPSTSTRQGKAPIPPPSTPTTNKPTLRSPHVAVIRAGSGVPQSHLIELKTRTSKSGRSWRDSYPQLFLSQTPHIYYAAHTDGNIYIIDKYTLGEPHLEAIDQNAQAGFKKLKMALTAIQELVRKHGTNGRISLVCQGKELTVYRRKGTESCLPKDALTLFRS